MTAPEVAGLVAIVIGPMSSQIFIRKDRLKPDQVMAIESDLAKGLPHKVQVEAGELSIREFECPPFPSSYRSTYYEGIIV